MQFSCFVVPQALGPPLCICHFTVGYSGYCQSRELAFPLRPHDRVPEFVCDTEATLKEKSDGKLLAGNRVNVREVTRCFPQLPLMRTPGGRKCLRVFPLAYGSFKGLVPNAVDALTSYHCRFSSPVCIFINGSSRESPGTKGL